MNENFSERAKRKPLEWETDKLFHSYSNLSEAAMHASIAVKVNRANGETKTFFSVELGRITSEGGFSRFLQPKIGRGVNYQAMVELPNVVGYEALIAEAAEYIRERVQADFDRSLDERREKEEANVLRGKPTQRPGLKRIGKTTPRTS
jgi:hypothetical protein